MVKINSIKKITNNNLLQIKKIKAGDNAYKDANENFELLFLFLTEFENISHGLALSFIIVIYSSQLKIILLVTNNFGALGSLGAV